MTQSCSAMPYFSCVMQDRVIVSNVRMTDTVSIRAAAGQLTIVRTCTSHHKVANSLVVPCRQISMHLWHRACATSEGTLCSFEASAIRIVNTGRHPEEYRQSTPLGADALESLSIVMHWSAGIPSWHAAKVVNSWLPEKSSINQICGHEQEHVYMRSNQEASRVDVMNCGHTHEGIDSFRSTFGQRCMMRGSLTGGWGD